MSFKKTTFALALFAVLMPVARSAYPDEPLRMVIPFAPGGTADIIGRVFAAQPDQEL
ncbi:hypothetical protein [Bordetella avium]|uniref:hypothetical protein n=1 Tax=Bordetella avium TaxID=521 RepID=UPI0002FCB89D|nr:hypothetical protein [Bordetella avium]WQE32318.1 hypothetical protein U0029_10320 [Bordetella avium]SUV69194.1 Uncharacterised protein [Bordetella avium]